MILVLAKGQTYLFTYKYFNLVQIPKNVENRKFLLV